MAGEQFPGAVEPHVRGVTARDADAADAILETSQKVGNSRI